jgi:hypothetical protein
MQFSEQPRLSETSEKSSQNPIWYKDGVLLNGRSHVSVCVLRQQRADLYLPSLQLLKHGYSNSWQGIGKNNQEFTLN